MKLIPKKQDGGDVSKSGSIEKEGSTVKKKKKNWLQGAVNPKHKGYCTPMTKSTCTPRRKAFAMTMKKHHGFHKKEDGGFLNIMKLGGILPSLPGFNQWKK